MPTPTPIDPTREALPVVAVIVNRMDLRNVIQWTHKGADLDDGECLCRLSDAKAALKAKDAEIEALKADAERYRYIRSQTSAQQDALGRKEFVLPDPHPLGNIMKGSVAQHLDAAIDALKEPS